MNLPETTSLRVHEDENIISPPISQFAGKVIIRQSYGPVRKTTVLGIFVRRRKKLPVFPRTTTGSRRFIIEFFLRPRLRQADLDFFFLTLIYLSNEKKERKLLCRKFAFVGGSSNKFVVHQCCQIRHPIDRKSFNYFPPQVCLNYGQVS